VRLGILTIVGVGLIGGSIGLAARRRRVAERVLGVGRQQSSLNLAVDLGAIDDGSLDLTTAVAKADLVVFCTPVQRIAEQVLAAAPHCKPGAVLTDAGSTKAEIVNAVTGRLPVHVCFIGSHPLAGSEKRGPEYAEHDLFEDRLTVVTPIPGTDPAKLEIVFNFWRALGSRVKVMLPEEHDRVLALTSHVPHLLAAALAGTLPSELRELTATGFRDTTRIAAGDPELWTGIFLQNRQAVLAALDRVTAQLGRLRTALTANDESTLNDLLDQAKKVRDALGS
jgi:prephenate dehydrogenase